MKNITKIKLALSFGLITLILSSCSEDDTVLLNIYNDYPVAVVLVPYTDTDGLIVDPTVVGLYLGDSETDSWGNNLMDYEIAPQYDGAVELSPVDLTDLKIVVEDKYSAGEIGLMSTHKRSFTHIKEGVSLNSDYTIHVSQ